MNRVFFRFYGELNSLLPRSWQDRAFACQFQGKQTVKHLIESCGVPHTEVLRIQAGEREVDFNYVPQDGEQIEVYPVTSAAQHGVPGSLQPRLPDELRFILDNHLGRLAAYLRLLGFDSLYRNDYDDETLAEIAGRGRRILLTRDRRLLMRRVVVYGYCVRQDEPQEQIVEVARRFGLREAMRPFQRCLRCNGLLIPTGKEAVIDRLEPLTERYFDEFAVCENCGQVYWKGSHYGRMQAILERVLQAEDDETGDGDKRSEGPK